MEMNNRRYLPIPAIFLIVLSVFISCQEYTEINAVNEQLPTLKQEMAAAHDLITTQIVENPSRFPENARVGGSSIEYVITLVAFDKEAGELVYFTRDDEMRDWTPVTEEEITAVVQPNSMICWVRSRGLSALSAIEFDTASNEILGEDNTIELINDLLWLTYVGSHVPENETLKYDIVYDRKGDGSGPIRLDPKVQIK